MAVLSFKVQADYEKVVKLREEIAKLETQLKGFGKNASQVDVKAVEAKLSEAKKEFTAVASEAAKAGATIDTDFKTKIRDAAKNVDNLTAEIIEQKATIRAQENDVKRLGDAYRKALKGNSSSTTALKEELDQARLAVDQAKWSLYDLTQEKAKAQLATKKLKDEYAEFKEEADEVSKSSDNMGISFGKVTALIGGAAALKQFASSIVQVRGQFQDMETSINTLVGEDMTAKLMPQIKEMAKVSPLTMTDIVGAEKMMLSFNIDAAKTIDYLKAMSDISMGNSQKFNSLTLAFSQMSSAGKLMGQDLLQMINAGFNPLQQISAKTGKSVAQLKEEMSKGAISAEMVQQAFLDATAAGGKFYNMSENASKTINGQISMLEDAWDAALNEIGTKSESLITGGIKGVTSLIQNYETIGKVLVGLVTTFGAYKAAVFAAVAAEKIREASLKQQTVATLLLEKANKALSASMLTNPFVAFTAVVVATTAAIVAYERANNYAKKSQRELDKAVDEAQKSAMGELRTLAQLKGELAACKKGTEEYNTVKGKIVSGYSKYYEGLEQEIERVGLLEETYKSLAQAISTSFSARQYDKFMKEQETGLDETLSKNLTKIYERLIKELGDEQGSQVYTKVREALMAGVEIDEDTVKILNEVQDKGKWNADSRLDQWIRNYQGAMANFKKVQQDAKVKFGITDEDIAKNQAGKTDSTSSTTQPTVDDSAKARAEANAKVDDLEKKHGKERARAAKDMEFMVEQARIDAMKDGGEKQLAQMKLNHEKELEQIERQKQYFIDKTVAQEKAMFDAQEEKKAASKKDYKKQTFDEAAARVRVSAQVEESYAPVIADTEAKQRMQEAELLKKINKDIIGDFETYQQKRQSILEKYAALEERFYQTDEQGNKTLKEGVEQGNVDELNRAKETELAANDAAFAQREESFMSWMNEIADYTLERLYEELERAEAELAKLEQENPTDEGIATARAKVGALKQKVSDKSKKTDTSPDKRSVKEWKDLQEELRSCISTFEEIGDAVGGVAGEVISTAGSIASSTLSMINGIVTLVTSSSAAMTGTAATAATAISTVEKASVILAVISAALQIVMAIFNAVKGAADKDNEKEIARLTAANKELDKSYEKLGKDIDKAYSVDASKLIEQQNTLLEQKKKNLELMIAEEEAKKDSDPEQVAEWKDQIASINDTIQDNKESAIEALAGQDVKSAIDSFADAYTEAWMEGADAAEASVNASKNMLRNALGEFLKGALADDVEAFNKRLAESMEDGIIEPWEEAQLDALRKKMDREAQNYYEQTSKYWEEASEEELSQQEASRGGYESLSEDTGNELVGRATAQYESSLRMEESVRSMKETVEVVLTNQVSIRDIAFESRELIADSYLELQQIRDNTGLSAKFLKAIDERMLEWDNKIKSL